jgi:hypothetical protein
MRSVKRMDCREIAREISGKRSAAGYTSVPGNEPDSLCGVMFIRVFELL